MTTLAYVRVSTEEQADSRLGLDAQRSAVERACSDRGLASPVFHEDGGVSGGKAERPELGRLLSSVRRWDVVVVAKLDRLSRSVVDFGLLVERSRREGWSIVCLDPDLDLTTPNGELLAGLLVCVAQWERAIIRQRTREAMRLNPRYRCIPEDVADRIQAMRDEQMSYGAICRVLTEEGVPTPRGGLRWRPSSLQRLLART